ncbi:MAG: shikimate dehydrogenase [Paracoccus sp. (in: a-proteobacteria)]|nr:shikimate dehydrogenase [Paracoccus sp. (in: a-proteobacteria)]
MIRLGLIGDNIARSKSPLLHRLAGRLCGLDVSYEPLIPADLGRSFDEVFADCAAGGFRGINITYPYKEKVTSRLDIPDGLTRAMGACNTVLFGGERPAGHNTDCSGFAAAFRAAFGPASPGNVAMAGAGGVGKAIAFALSSLGARRLALFEPDRGRAEALAASLRSSGSAMETEIATSIEAASEGAGGFINSTPLGMVGHPGTAFPPPLLARGEWAFDAVYTPADTEFLKGAARAGLQTISGYELFFHQGIDAFRHFTGQSVDPAQLRAALADKGGGAPALRLA